MKTDRFGPLLALSCLLALPAGSALAECSQMRMAGDDAKQSPIILAQNETNTETTGDADEACEPGTEGCIAESGEEKQENGTGGAEGNTSSEGGGDATENDDANRSDGNTSSEGGGDAGEGSGGGNSGGSDSNSGGANSN